MAHKEDPGFDLAKEGADTCPGTDSPSLNSLQVRQVPSYQPKLKRLSVLLKVHGLLSIQLLLKFYQMAGTRERIFLVWMSGRLV